MKNFTLYSDEIFDTSVVWHEMLLEDNFYKEQCQVEIEPKSVIKFICSQLFEIKIENGTIIMKDHQYDNFIKSIGAYCVFESLKKKGLVDSIEKEGEDVYFLKKKGKDLLDAA